MLMIELMNFKNLENAPPFLYHENSPVFFSKRHNVLFLHCDYDKKEHDRYP